MNVDVNVPVGGVAESGGGVRREEKNKKEGEK